MKSCNRLKNTIFVHYDGDNVEEAINDSGNMVTGIYILQTHVLLCFTLLCFTDVMGFFYKLKARPSTSQKIMTHFILLSGTEPAASLWRGCTHLHI